LESFPDQIGRYRILEVVGRGGMAVVYRGVDLSLDREVAVKVLHAHLAGSEESRARFEREARATARLRHPHIIEIFDFAETSEAGAGPSYIVTEFVHGKTLKDFMDDSQAFFPEVAAMIAIQICEAVSHAHSLSIIHRDLKPENVMVDNNGVLKLMDFGIAKVIDQQQQMTLTGTLLGSPAHMAPELLEGKELDQRSDLFSVGTILFWLSTGQLPFSGKNPHQVIKRIVQGDFTNPQQLNPATGGEFSRIIRRALQNDPQDRYQTASSLQSALHAYLDKVDLGDVDSELKFFFADPKNYVEKLKDRLSKKLFEDGKAALKKGDHRTALEALDRVLAFEPGHPEVIHLVDGIHRRERLKRRLAAFFISLVLVLLVAAGVWAAVAYWPETDGDEGLDAGAVIPPPLMEEPAVAKTEDAGAPKADDPAPGPADRPPKTADRTKVAIHPVRKPVFHRIQIVAEPYFDSIHIDGKQVASINDESTKSGQEYSGELSTGKHEVVIKNRFCQDDEFDIVVPRKPKPGELDIRRKLHFRPAILVVETDLPEAEVYVDGKFQGNATNKKPNRITITMERGMGKRDVHLRVVAQGVGEFRDKIEVKAGEQIPVRANRKNFKKPDGGGK
jgi:serine/threonine protein kinase